MNLEMLLCASLESLSFNRYMFSHIGRGQRFRLTLCFGVSRIRARSATIAAAQQGNSRRPNLFFMQFSVYGSFEISLRYLDFCFLHSQNSQLGFSKDYARLFGSWKLTLHPTNISTLLEILPL